MINNKIHEIKYFLFAVLLLASNISISQNIINKSNSIFFELAGFTGGLSVNYEKRIMLRKNIGLSLGIGYSSGLLDLKIADRIDDFSFSPRLPIATKIFHQINKHSIEYGFGFIPYIWYNTDYDFKTNLKKTQFGVMGNLGYKYTFIKQNIFLSLSFTPLIYDIGDFEFFPWGAFRLGYNF